MSGSFGSLFDDPVGFIKPVAAGGGGVSKVGSAVFKYTSLTDPPGPSYEQSVSMNRVILKPDTAYQQSVSNTVLTLKPDANYTQDATADITLFADSNHTQDVSRLQIDPTEMLASKDSWVDATVGCIGGGTNHDGTDLQCEGIVASRKDPIFGWDVSGFDANATVTEAIVTLNMKTAPGTNGTITLNTISNANEGWDETTVVCNNIPAAVASAGTFSTTAGPGEIQITLNATGRAALEAAMGSSTFSIRLTSGSLVTNHVYESADEGTNDNLGPRLDFVFTVPV